MIQPCRMVKNKLPYTLREFPVTAAFKVCLAVTRRDTLAHLPNLITREWICWERALLTHQVGFGCLNIGVWCHSR